MPKIVTREKSCEVRRSFSLGQLHLTEISSYVPWVSFIAGLGGSLHCVGMCGGLVTATCEQTSDIFRYQVGRLIGYLLLGAFAGWFGSLLQIKNLPPYASLVPAMIVGGLFIFWGVQHLRGKKAELPTPKFLNKFYFFLWGRFVKNNSSSSKSFFTGLISILLPCGFLYGVVLGTVALENFLMAMISMFFFWLGTVPSMVAAPEIFKRLLTPLKQKLPKFYAITLVIIGVSTISLRMIKFHQKNMTSQSHQESHHESQSCH